MLCNTAIFYDIENLLGIFSGKTNTVLNLDEIYRRVLETEGVHGVSIQKAYADWALFPNRALRDSVLQVGIEPIQIFNTNQNDRVKNAADVSLIIDTVELVAKRPEIENYVIASGDGIFAFLSKKLHEYGKRVIGCGFDRNASVTFRYACDYYIGLEKTDKSLVATTSTRRKSRVVEETTTPQTTTTEVTTATATAAATPKVPNKFPKTKYSEALAKADISIWKDPYDVAGSLHVVRKILDALFVEETEGLPDLEISIFKTYLVHYVPGFRLSRYSISGFGEFMRFVLTGSPYCLYTIDESVCKITRRGTDVKNATFLEDVKGLVVTAEDGSRFGSIFAVPADTAFIYTILSDTPAAPKNGRRKKKVEIADPPEKANINATDTPNKTKGTAGKPKNTTNKAKIASKNAKDTVAPAVQVASAAEPVTNPGPVIEATTSVLTTNNVASSEMSAKDPEAVAGESGSFRKWVKDNFQVMSDTNALSTILTRQLTTAEYAKKTFGIRTPILREIESRSNLLEQRSINGKVKYWKETYIFNGKHYLVYKDWVANIHKDRFAAWLNNK